MPPKAKAPKAPSHPAAAPKKKAETPKQPTSSQPAKKKTKVARQRKNHGNDIILAPGTDPKTFVQLHKGEGQVGSYAMFGRRDEFRKFALSSLVLNAYTNSYTGRRAIQVRQRDVIEYIRDEEEKMKSEACPIDVYPEQSDDIHALQRTALACAQLCRQVERAASGQWPFDQEQEKKIVSAFTALTGKKVPVFDRSDVSVKSFGPYVKYGESDLEPYSRAFNVIMYLSWSMSSKVWSTRFENAKWDEEVRFSTAHVPHWMRERDGTKRTARAPDQAAATTEPPKPNVEVQVSWKMTSLLPEQQELTEWLSETGLIDQIRPELPITIRPTATVAEVRDIIRAKFQLDQNQAQIATLQLKSSLSNIMQQAWSGVQKELWSGSDPKPVFTMTCYKRDDGETLWENEQVPGLSGAVLVTDGGNVLPVSAPAPAPAVLDEDNDGSLDALVDTINQYAGATVDTLPQMLNRHFKGRKEDLTRFFTIDETPHDVQTPEGLLAFQQKAFQELTRRDKVKVKYDDKSRKFGRTQLSLEQLAIFNDARQDGHTAAMSMPDDGGEARYYALNAIHTGTKNQVGLPILPSALALQMTAYEDKTGRKMYRSHLPGLQKSGFYPYQVSGCATLLIAMYGEIPVPKNASEEVVAAADKLKGLALGGRLLCDQTGTGKSKIFLLAVHYSRYCIRLDDTGTRVYKYATLAVPSSVIKQWADDVINQFPALRLIISYDEASLPEKKYEQYFVKATAMKNMERPELWPARFHYIFDKHDEKTGETLILTSHDTLVKRGLKGAKEEVRAGKRFDPATEATDDFDPHELDADGNSKHWEVPPIEEMIYTGLQKGRVGIAGVDEAHRLKDNETMRWKAFKELEAEYVLIIGATPMANVSVVRLSHH